MKSVCHRCNGVLQRATWSMYNNIAFRAVSNYACVWALASDVSRHTVLEHRMFSICCQNLYLACVGHVLNLVVITCMRKRKHGNNIFLSVNIYACKITGKWLSRFSPSVAEILIRWVGWNEEYIGLITLKKNKITWKGSF